MHFRHVRIDVRARALLTDLLPYRRTLVREAIGERGLVFDPPLARTGYGPEDLLALVQYDLVSLRQVGEDWSCAVTPHGRDYAAETLPV